MHLVCITSIVLNETSIIIANNKNKMKMKKLFLGVLLIASAVTYTTAQQSAVEASKWSIALKGGGTYYRVSPGVEVPPYTNNMNWGAGLIIERTANPLFGMGLDVSYLNFHATKDKSGKTIDPTLFASFNLSNLFFPYREKATWNVFSKFGAGASIWDNNNPSPIVINGKKANKGVQPVFTATLHPEVNLGRVVALGAEVGYRYYPQEILGGGAGKDNGNDALTAMLSLRFKLGGDHARNMSMTDFYPAPAPVVMQTENKYDDSQILNRLDNIDRQNQDIQNRLSKLEQAVKDLESKPTGSSATVSFQNIQFKFDSSELTEESYPTLAQIASILKDNPTWSTLKVKGHTDSTGPESYNKILSERRAQAVKDYLVSQGVSASVVSTEGYGEGQPIATNDTAEGRKANRRVEFEVVK